MGSGRWGKGGTSGASGEKRWLLGAERDACELQKCSQTERQRRRGWRRQGTLDWVTGRRLVYFQAGTLREGDREGRGVHRGMGSILRGRRFWEARMELRGRAGLDTWMKALLAWECQKGPWRGEGLREGQEEIRVLGNLCVGGVCGERRRPRRPTGCWGRRGRARAAPQPLEPAGHWETLGDVNTQWLCGHIQ